MSTKKVLYAIFFSGEGVAIKVPVEKGKSITGKYYKDVVLKKLKTIIRNDALPPVLNMSASTWQCPSSYLRNSYGVFEERKSNCFVSPAPPPPPPPQTLPHVISFCFRNWKHSLLGGNTSPDRHLDLPFISTSLLCPNQRTLTPSRSGYIGWNFAFLATGSTSRAWNEYFWANLKFEVSR